jgi:hypothetical protein
MVGAMIQLPVTADDDPRFLGLAQRIVNGAISALRVPELYLVHVDNWFDHKWLGWWSSWEEKQPKILYVPPFNPNRILAQHHYLWDSKNSAWALAGKGKDLHRRVPGRRARSRRKLDEIAPFAAFIWYSANTVANRAGSLMLYLSGTEGYAWYASFLNDLGWKVNDEFHVTRRELIAFEECGRSAELMQATCCEGDNQE